MGTWGTGVFENDFACDWALELKECDDLALIQEGIESVVSDDYIDAFFAFEGLAAIDTLTRLKGCCSGESSGNEIVDQWIAEHDIDPPQTLVERAKKSLNYILGDESELNDLWKETKYFEEWKAVVLELEKRLGE